MRILFLHGGRDWSGTARAFAVAARGLAARGHEVTFLAEPDTSVEQSATRMATVAAKLGAEDPVAQREVAPFAVVQFPYGGFWFAAALRLRRLFREWDADVVFVTTAREQVLAAMACWLGRRGAVVRRAPAGTVMEVRGLARVATWLATTRYLFTSDADLSRQRLPRRSARPLVAPLGVDVSRYPERVPPADETPDASKVRYIICPYDAASRGRAATAIRTLAMLTPRHPYLRIMIFGAGSDSEDLRMQAAALGVLDLVSFLGERDDHLTLMRDADIGWVVAGDDSAAFGILDLMALSIPVIAADADPAGTYVADLISGRLIPPDDSATAAAAVVTLLRNEDQRLAVGAAGRTRVAREFPEHEMIDGFENAAAAASGRARERGRY